MRRRKLNKSPVLGLCGFVVGYECKEKGIKLMECDKAQADAIIVPHHFSHKVTKNSCLNLLVLYKDKIRGAMQIGYGIRPHIKTEKGEVLDYHQVREFDECGCLMICQSIAKPFAFLSCTSILGQRIRKSSILYLMPIRP